MNAAIGPATGEPDLPVTVIRSRRVKPGQEAAFEVLIAGLVEAARRFEGHQGATVLRPVDPADPEYRVVFRFDRLSNLRRWERSEERARWVARVREVTEREGTEELTGLEAWFPPPPAAPAPSRHRMAFVTWAAIYPLITLILALLGPWLLTLPLPLRTLVLTAVLVPAMTYLVMPWVTRRLRPWLYPG